MTGHTPEEVEKIAKVCHAANTAWCEAHNDTIVPWEQGRNSSISRVQFVLANPDAPDSALHDDWMEEKLADGWKHGEIKSLKNKTHPCLVPFGDLPPHQQVKDRLFRNIVRALTS